jgi:hypothetical protein
MKVAVPWLQHSQRFGHCALSQTVCNRKSEISALVEKKTGFDGNRTLIQGGFFAWCRVGSIFAQDISKKSYNVKNVTKVKLLSSPKERVVRTSRTYSKQFRFVWISDAANIGVVPPIFFSSTANSSRIRPNLRASLLKCPKFGSDSR